MRVDVREQLGDEPALADPRLADDRDELRRVPRRPRRTGLGAARRSASRPTNGVACAAREVEPAGPVADGVEDPDRLGLALERGRLELLVLEAGRVASHVVRPTATPITGATDWIATRC